MNRRKLLGLLGITGVSMAGRHSSINAGTGEVARKMISCVVTPQQTEGPYFVDERLRRSDIRSDPSDGSVKDGLPLALEMRVFTIGSEGTDRCLPLAGAIVDIWHCDAQGIYSDVEDRNFNTMGKKFLRGYQVTDRNGSVRFITIYPGWYPGRTVHIHFKIRTDPGYAHGREFTSQLYFDDTLTDKVHTQRPYAEHAKKGSYQQRTRNEDDSIYLKGGRQLMLKLAEAEAGYATAFDVGLEAEKRD